MSKKIKEKKNTSTFYCTLVLRSVSACRNLRAVTTELSFHVQIVKTPRRQPKKKKKRDLNLQQRCAAYQFISHPWLQRLHIYTPSNPSPISSQHLLIKQQASTQSYPQQKPFFLNVRKPDNNGRQRSTGPPHAANQS